MSWVGDGTDVDDGTNLAALSFFAADHAAVENGKAYVNGGFINRMVLGSVPGHMSMAVVAVLHVPWRHFGQRHTFAVRLLDADGGEHPSRAEGGFGVEPTAGARLGDPAVVPLVMHFTQVRMERTGDYVFSLEVDGEPLARWSLQVVAAVAA